MKKCLSNKKFLLVLILGTSINSIGYPHAQDQDSISTTALKRRSLEELMDIDITIVAKQSQRWFESAAAVYVIPNEDIRRSGARSIPEALRLAPNLNVAQVSASQWAISARGFNTTSSNKLHVMIDGRSIYTPLYSGVFWDSQDIVLEDVDRIEVISGPGGTLWGTNAVNGIINIISKSAKETSAKPLYIQAGTGIREKMSFAIRSGGTLGDAGSHRVYLKYFDRNENDRETGLSANDQWSSLQAGFRIDYDLSPKDEISVQGDMYRAKINQFNNTRARVEGGDVLAKWNHHISERSSLTLLPSLTYIHRRFPNSYGQDLGLLDIELEHRMGLGEAHDVSWGFGFRHGNDRILNSTSLAFLPAQAEGQRYTGFLQDIFSVANDLKLTLGAKFHYTKSSKIQIQPRVSLAWSISNSEFLWASVSRAVRTPSRIDRSLFAPAQQPYLLAGGPAFVSEKLVAFETGYRVQPGKRFLFDLALFYNIYDDLRSVSTILPYVIENDLKARTYGGEITISTQLMSWWTMRTGYSHLQKFISLKPGGADLNNGMGEGNDHKHRLLIQSLMDLTEHWELDLWFRLVDRLPNLNAIVPAYTALDCRIGWNPNDNFRISLLLQNIFPARHVEFGAAPNRQQIGREVYGTISFSM